ncbi:hypothetical protein J2Z35_001789 [Acetoanaerobium pronyense]|uniref:Trypsin-like peptidase domain-containing protein n=1 Tax=Acetoanaerobium pronyense TaxID=1482736 RepID=A0ABS4KKX9_9FIRM|nr:trypsin-like peptidase domain-containing protein [Acetoanaerobium pronyense]MBP2027990.1 hypothetical protein [Acetoanaerobium pronyense]
MKILKKFTSLLVITLMIIINPLISYLPSEAISSYKDISVMIVTSDNIGTMTIGSGFPYSDDGKIITNYHVIEKALYGGIIFEGAENLYPFSIIGVDKINDIAVLKIEKETTPLKTSSLSSLKVGDSVTAVGNPLGVVNVASEGKVTRFSDDSIYFTAPIDQGNSGGPLLNSKGEVIGIVTAIVSSSGYSSSYATPAHMIESVPLNLNVSVLPFSNLLEGLESHGEYYYHLEMVLNGTLNSIPSATVEEAFNDFFVDPEFSHFISVDGSSVIEFTGICLYNDALADILIQFVIDDEDVFYIHYMEVNGLSKDNIEILELLRAINDYITLSDVEFNNAA